MRKQCRRIWVAFFLCFFLADLSVFAGECVKKIEAAEWGVEGVKLEGYRFPEREFKMELFLNSEPFLLNGQSRFTALVNWWNVEVVAIRGLSKSNEVVNIAGYFAKPDYHQPGVAIIFVKNKERKKQIENDIEEARKKFAKNCFGCKELGIIDPGPGPKK